ncbi:30S ribosomal protein S14 [Candidatus Woesearchaeota archaeon]|nr:30S ribosomal protein S14 [Candidatus Woesearchaeota archaeon]
MSYSNYDKVFKQLSVKPPKLQKYKKHNAPKARSCGRSLKRCRRCGRIRAHIGKYAIHVCRQCFRDIAVDLGFKKYG